nr:hypothetical protein [Actinopolymorpha pittospori]
MPGVAAGATHGVIRTAQAIRALADDPHNPQRRAELAAGLAYWAARYVELPGAARTQGRRSMAQALAAMPSVQIPDRGLIVEQLAPVGAAPEFAAGVAALQAPAETPAALNAAFEELTRTFADIYVTYGRGNPIGLVHAVTAPTAVHSILDHLPPTVWRASHDALWHVCAALYTAYAHGKPRDDAPTGPGQDPDVSVAKAVASGDEHAIKLAEACLRQYRATSAPAYLYAASRGMYAAA